MRYLNIDDIEFENSRGETKVLKELRKTETYDRIFEVENKGEALDYIAVKTYGTDGEPKWYRIADQNVQQIVARKFNLSSISKFEVPIV